MFKSPDHPLLWGLSPFSGLRFGLSVLFSRFELRVSILELSDSAQLPKVYPLFPDRVTFWLKNLPRGVLKRLQIHIVPCPTQGSRVALGSNGVNSQESPVQIIRDSVWHYKCSHPHRRLKNIAGTTFPKMEGDKRMKNLFARLWKEEEGQDLTEYGLLLVLIALAAVAAMGKLASAISTVFVNASSTLAS